MSRNQFLWALAGVGFSICSAQADSLRQIAVRAAHYDARVSAAGRDVEAARATIAIAEAGDNFSAGIAAEFGVGDLRTKARFPQSGQRYPNTVGISASKPLYNGGRTAAEEHAAQQRLRAALESHRNIGGLIVLAALTAALDVKRDHEILRLATFSAQSLAQARDDAKALLKAGEATKTNVAVADARVAEAAVKVLQAQAQIRVAERALARTVGEGEAPNVPWPSGLVLPSSAEQSMALARRAPAALAAQALAEAGQADVQRVRASQLPEVKLDARLGSQDNSDFGFDRVDTWSVLLKLQMPLTTGGLVRAQISQAAAHAEGQRFLAVDEAEALAQEAASEWELLQAAQGAIVGYQSQVEAARLALDGVKKEFKAGSRTTLDILDAERELLQAQVNVVAARRDTAVTAFRLMAAAGTLELENIPDQDVTH